VPRSAPPSPLLAPHPRPLPVGRPGACGMRGARAGAENISQTVNRITV